MREKYKPGQSLNSGLQIWTASATFKPGALGLMTVSLPFSHRPRNTKRVFIFSLVRCTIAFGCGLLASNVSLFSKPSKSLGCLAKYTLSQLELTYCSVSQHVWEVSHIWPGLFQILMCTVMFHLCQLLSSSVVLRINQHAGLVNQQIHVCSSLLFSPVCKFVEIVSMVLRFMQSVCSMIIKTTKYSKLGILNLAIICVSTMHFV